MSVTMELVIVLVVFHWLATRSLVTSLLYRSLFVTRFNDFELKFKTLKVKPISF